MLTNDEVIAFLAVNVQKRLEEMKWSQARLASETGENAMMISRIVNKEILPNAATLARIAEAMGVSIDFLLREPVAAKKSRKHA